MKKYLQKVMCILLFAGILCTGCGRQTEVYSSVDTAMGTIISQTIYVSKGGAKENVTGAGSTRNADNAQKDAREITAEILACTEALENDCLSWRLDTSEIYRINASAGSGQTIALSDRLSHILEQCMKVYEASDGAFDVTIGRLARLWNIDTWASMTQATSRQVSQQQASDSHTEYTPPAQEEIASVVSGIRAGKLLLEGHEMQLPAGMQLDLGAVGKGIVLDEAKEILARHEEVTGAVISAGGSILTYGQKPDGKQWNVAIVDPFDTSKSLGILRLSGQWCVSTSGDYERYVLVDGVRYHHILNPATGYPADSGVKSVTILTDSGLFSDALSTACFVLGVEEGLELAESFQAEALFVDTRGEIIMTEGMSKYFVEQ